MSLGQFVPPARGKAGSFDPRYNADKPLIVVPREFRPDFATKRFPDPRDVIIVDIVDVLADTVHLSVIWGSASIVDQLKNYAPAEGQTPQKLPVSVKLEMSATGNQYATVVPLEGKSHAVAEAWDQKHPTRIDDERRAKEAEDQVNATAAGNSGGSTAELSPLVEAPPQQPSAPTQPSKGLSDADLEAALASLR